MCPLVCMYQSVCSICPPVHLSRLSICLSVCLFLSVYPSICLSVCSSVCLSVCSSVCLSVCSFAQLSCLSVCTSVFPCVHLSAHPFVLPWFVSLAAKTTESNYFTGFISLLAFDGFCIIIILILVVASISKKCYDRHRNPNHNYERIGNYRNLNIREGQQPPADNQH